MIVQPRLLSLDTATWGLIANDTSDDSKRILAAFQSGSIIPFFTETHLQELTQHESDSVFAKRLELLQRLPFVSYIRCSDPNGVVGFVLDLHEREIAILRDCPGITPGEVVEKLRPHFADGFCSGSDLCQKCEDFWRLWRGTFAPYSRAKSAEAASLAQFPLPGTNLQERLPSVSEEIEVREKEDVIRHFKERLPWLAERLKSDGDRSFRADSGHKEADRIAAEFIRESYEDVLPLLDRPGNLLEEMLAAAGVERDRLPAQPTIEDVGFEATFIGHLKIHERRLNLPAGTLKKFVRQETLPSWIIQSNVDRGLRTLKRAEGSSFNDKLMLPFALYVDLFEADKRICECVRQASKKHPLMKLVETRVFRRGSLKQLAEKLESFATVS